MSKSQTMDELLNGIVRHRTTPRVARRLSWRDRSFAVRSL
jgi:hypothetical protein